MERYRTSREIQYDAAHDRFRQLLVAAGEAIQPETGTLALDQTNHYRADMVEFISPEAAAVSEKRRYGRTVYAQIKREGDRYMVVYSYGANHRAKWRQLDKTSVADFIGTFVEVAEEANKDRDRSEVEGRRRVQTERDVEQAKKDGSKVLGFDITESNWPVVKHPFEDIKAYRTESGALQFTIVARRSELTADQVLRIAAILREGK